MSSDSDAPPPVRLTQYSHGGGCGCKLGPADLRAVVSRLPRAAHPDLLVGVETGDDAAAWRVAPDVAVLQTLDFFMPVVDDPYDFGRIAATNAISDIYAMGGTPTMALAIVGMPVKKLPPGVMAVILEGGAAACAAAGIHIVGGHSIDDEEPKFGLSVTGVVHPDRIWRNCTGREGDLLVLTKPIGVGTLASSVKNGRITPERYAQLIRVTTFLNRVPAEAAREVGVTAATDVTGFSLLGHTHEMAVGAGLAAELWLDRVPVIPGARESLSEGTVPGATGRNLAHYGADAVWDDGVTELDRTLLADPQTSGGLLFAVAPEHVDALVAALHDRGALAAAVVGRLQAREDGAPTLRVRLAAPTGPG
jgi:selenide,water dikinase